MIKKLNCITLLIVLLVTILAVSACAAEYKLKMGSSSGPEYFTNRAKEAWIKAIKEGSNGNIEIENYVLNSLGTEKQQVEMVSLGTVDFGGLGSQFVSNYAEELGALGIPFLIKDYEHMQRVIKSGVLDDYLKKVEKSSNQKILGWGFAGIRHLTTKDILVRTPEDLKGVKIRCMPSPFYQDAISSLGASPTPVAYSELYMALQTGVVQGQENPVTAIFDSKLYDVQNYLMLTGHEYYGSWMTISQITWDKLPKEYQQLIQKTYDEVYMPKVFQFWDEDENKILATLAKNGMNIIIPDKKAFREYSTEYMMNKYGDKWGDLIEAISNVK